jgi:hypothetical protein
LVALSVNVSAAVRVPDALGENAMLAVQLAEATRLVPQVLLEIEKSPAFVPEIATLLMVIEVERLLVSVADCVALAAPTVVLEKVKLVGLLETLPLGLVPKPVSVMVCGLLPSESLKFSVALRLPVVVGTKDMFAVQLAEAAREEPQVLLYILKSPGFAPVSVTLEIVIAAAFPLVSVTTFWPPALPTATETQLRVLGETVAAAKQLIAGRIESAMIALPAMLNFLSIVPVWLVLLSTSSILWRFVDAETAS